MVFSDSFMLYIRSTPFIRIIKDHRGVTVKMKLVNKEVTTTLCMEFRVYLPGLVHDQNTLCFFDAKAYDINQNIYHKAAGLHNWLCC